LKNAVLQISTKKVVFAGIFEQYCEQNHVHVKKNSLTLMEISTFLFINKSGHKINQKQFGKIRQFMHIFYI